MLEKLKSILTRPISNKIEGESSVNEDIFFTKNKFSDINFKIGDYTYGTPNILFAQSGAQLEIGKFCSIADEVTIFLGGNHRIDWNTTYPFNDLPIFFPKFKNIKGHPSTKGDVTIGNDVWIGRGVTILSGVTIGDGAVIGANSVVSKDIGPYEVWAGNPARLIKKRFSEIKISELLNIKWWEWDIEEIKKNVHLLCSTKNIHNGI